MKKVITLAESELIDMIEKIVESKEELRNYTNLDIADAFVTLVRNWIRNNYGEKYNNHPFSWVVENFIEGFLKELYADDGDGLRRILGGYYGWSDLNVGKMRDVVQKAIDKGLYSLPSLRQNEKFTEKYRKHLKQIIKLLNLPEWVTLEITEPRPHELLGKLIIDFPTMIKNDNRNWGGDYEIRRNLMSMFKELLGIDNKSPIHGGTIFNMDSVKLVGEEEWIKKVLNKEIKPKIKKIPIGNLIHSIKFEPSDKKADLTIRFKHEASFREQDIIRRAVKELLRDEGYPGIMVF